LTALDRCCWD
jgi:hypothetical protein